MGCTRIDQEGKGRDAGRRSGVGCGGMALAVVLVSAAFSSPVRAQEHNTVWHCWYNRDTRLQCMIRESLPAISAVSLETGTDALAVADRRFWASQGHLDGAPVFIPLHTHPEDWEFTRLLAESVMCGKETVTCRVIFSRSYIDAARLDPGLER